jgi:hypothetical protein
MATRRREALHGAARAGLRPTPGLAPFLPALATLVRRSGRPRLRQWNRVPRVLNTP